MWLWNAIHAIFLLFGCLICPYLLQILFNKVRRVVVAFTDDKIQETEFLTIILNAASSQRAKIRHFLNPFEIARAIQLCWCDLAW